jgi:propanol-preferring alcohol dehydrogenase
MNMRGWTFIDTHEPLVLMEFDDPSPGPGEVILDVMVTGLCHSDVGMMTDPTWLQTLAFRPIILGHEIAGVVHELGAGVTNVAVGDRVGVCPSAGHGPPGYQRHGGFTTRHRVHSADLVPLPDALSFELGALGTDAGMTAYHGIVTRGQVAAGMKVGVIGLGGLGQIGARVGVIRGAEIHVAEPNEAAWPLAHEIGATSVVKDAAEWAGGNFDLIVDYAGFDITTRSATKAVRRGGRIVIVGLGKLETTLDTLALVRSEIDVVGSGGGTWQDVADIYELLASGEVSPQWSPITFDDIPRGLDDLRHHRITGRLVARIGA